MARRSATVSGMRKRRRSKVAKTSAKRRLRKPASVAGLRAQMTATSRVLELIAKSPSNLQPVFDAIVQTVVQLVGCETAFIQRCDGRHFWSVARCRREDGLVTVFDPRHAPIDPNANFPSRAIVSRTTLHLPDWSQIELPEFERCIQEQLGYQSAVYLPLLREEECIGVLGLAGSQPGMFGEAEIALAESFRDQALIAIENTRLFNEVQTKTHDLEESLQQQTSTADVLKVISRSTFDLQAALTALVAAARELCNAQIGTLFLPDHGVLRLASQQGCPPELTQYFADHPLALDQNIGAVRAFRAGQPVHIPDVLAEPGYGASVAQRLGGWRSLVAVPLLRGQEAIGVFSLSRTGEPEPFKQRQIDLLNTFADQAVIAVENARLFNETREALERQTATADILKVIASSPDDVQPVFEAIASSARRLIGGFSTAVHLVIDDMVHLVAYTPTTPEADEILVAAHPRHRSEVGAVALVENGEIAQIADAETADPHTRQLGRARGWRSVTLTPLMNQGSFIGFIASTRREPGVLADHQLELLRTFADQAVIAIQNTRLFNETQEALERQTATAEVLNVIAASPTDTQPVFDVIARSATELCEGTNGGVFRLQDGLVHFVGHHNLSAEQLTYAPKAFPAPPHRGFMAGRAILDRTVAHVPDIAADPEYTAEAMVRAGFRSAVSVPMLRNGEPIGAINVTREEARPFSDPQIELLKSFADQAVIAIENARLFDEVQAKTRDLTESLQQQTATADVLKVISRSAFDLEAVFETVVERSARLSGVEGARANIFRYDGELLRITATYNVPPKVREWLEQNPIRPGRHSGTARAALERRTIHVPDVLADPEYTFGAKAFEPYRTILGVPIIKANDLLGVLLIYLLEFKPFDDKQISLVETFADQAAIAIENTRLFNETKEALERQTATADILNVIASSPTDTQPVFEAIASRAKSLVGGFSGTVFRFIDGQAQLEAFTPTTPEADEVLKASLPRPAAEFAPFRLTRSGEVMQIPDTEALTDQMKDVARARGYRSMLFAPLLNKGVSIGCIGVTRVQPGRFAEDHVQLLRTFADQAVIAIENARLFDEVQEKTRELEVALQQQTATADVLKVISRSAFDLDTVLTTLAESARAQCRATGAYIVMREGDELRFHVIAGEISDEFTDMLRAARLRVRPDTLTGRAVATGEVVHIADVPNDTTLRWGAERQLAEFGSGLSVPLILDGERLGAFVIGHRDINAFTPDLIELVKTFADQAIIAIKNARLFEQVQARTQELSRSLEDLRTAQDRLVQTEKLASLGQLTAGIAHEIKNPLNFVNNFSALSAELIDELDETLAPAALDQKMRDDVGELTGMLKSNLEKVVQHGKRADSIVKNMLLHSREGSGERRSQDLNALVSESLNLAYHGARAERSDFNITLEQDLDPDAGAVEVFPQDITRALLNLFSNGFYAAISRKKEADGATFEPVLCAATRNAGNAVEIRIRDNGTGIPAEIREKIFNPFFTTKPTGEGTGLGLSMTHDIIVKQHGGRIDLATEAGAFTEFTITLPRENGGTKPT